MAQIVPKQAGSGDPSPDNVRPISRCDAVTVEQRGKNLLEPKFYGNIKYNASVGASAGTPTEYSDVVDNHDGSWTRACATWGQCSMIAPVVPGVTYKLSGTISAPNIAVCAYIVDDANNVLAIVNPNNFTISDLSLLSAFTPSASAKYLFLYIATRSAGDIVVTRPMLEVNSTADQFEPYTGSTYSVPLPQTVYGGQVDVVSGEGKVNWVSFDLSSRTWTMSNSRFSTISKLPDYISGNHANCICNRYVSDTGAANRAVDKSICFANDGYVYIYDTAYTTLEDFTASLSGIEFAYKVSTPTDFTVTPQEVPTLYGSNTVYADSGDVAVEYPADTKLYINKVIADAVSALS